MKRSSVVSLHRRLLRGRSKKPLNGPATVVRIPEAGTMDHWSEINPESLDVFVSTIKIHEFHTAKFWNVLEFQVTW